MIDKQKDVVMTIYEGIAKERMLFLKICSFTDIIQSFIRIYDQNADNMVHFITKNLENLSHKPFREYSRVYNAEIRDSVKFHNDDSQRVDFNFQHSSSSETSSEQNLSKKIIFSWINNHSCDAGMKTEPLSGRALARYLPQYERVKEFSELRNGLQLCRIIMAMVHDVCDVCERTGREDVVRRLSLDHWSALQKLFDDPLQLLNLILKHAAFYLRLPLFRGEDIINGSDYMIECLISSLMILEIPISHPESTKRLEKEKLEIVSLGVTVKHLNEEVHSQQQFVRINSLWKSIYENMEPALRNDIFNTRHKPPLRIPNEINSNIITIDNNNLKSNNSNDEMTQMPHADEISENSRVAFFHRLEDSILQGQRLPVERELIEKFPIFELHANYEHLLHAIDVYLEEGGDVKLFKYLAQIEKNMSAIQRHNNNVGALIEDSNSGISIAADIQLKVITHNLILQLKQLNWVTE